MDANLLYIGALDTHTMGQSLRQYVNQKIHPDLQDASLCQILVVGSLLRPPDARVSPFEPHGLPLNFRRPTTSIINKNAIRLNCFPSNAMIVHYASLVTTYLSLREMDCMIVQPVLIDPDETAKLIHKSNIRALGQTDIVIVGDVHYLKELTGDQWEGDSGSVRDIFRWQKFVSSKGKSVALLGCLDQLWGEMGHHLIDALRLRAGARCVVYIGKTGSLCSEYAPNEWIATGDHFFIGDESLKWHNPLKQALVGSTRVIEGPIVTIPTPLCETQEWLKKWPNTSWVDCEVGYMARVAKKSGVRFGFLHIVSDNLHDASGENLSNEDLEAVKIKRQILYVEIERIIKLLISEWDHDTDESKLTF
jgi:hypothetical protein